MDMRYFSSQQRHKIHILEAPRRGAGGEIKREFTTWTEIVYICYAAEPPSNLVTAAHQVLIIKVINRLYNITEFPTEYYLNYCFRDGDRNI